MERGRLSLVERTCDVGAVHRGKVPLVVTEAFVGDLTKFCYKCAKRARLGPGSGKCDRKKHVAFRVNALLQRGPAGRVPLSTLPGLRAPPARARIPYAAGNGNTVVTVDVGNSDIKC